MNCPPHSLEFDSALGQSFCRLCGGVFEENGITAEVTFFEGADGAARMMGQFVSNDRAGLRGVGLKNRRMNAGLSREETIANARRRFQQVAIALKGLGEYHVERAVQCYKLALSRNFTQGRKQGSVVAACLYTVCRQEKTMHMLIDFSDVFHTNVYTLGTTFLRLIRLLDIRLPLIDPSLYMARFAAHPSLKLTEDTEKLASITNDALRIIQRMRRDWIHYGRRPSGLCGAALFIACRMHGYNRTETDIVRVVKICENTLRKRLQEFSNTPSGELSVEQFRSTDLGEEADPPCFIAARANERLQKRKRLLEQSGDPDDETIEKEMKEAIEREMKQPITYLPKWIDVEVSADIGEWTDLSEDEEIKASFLTEEESEAKRNLWEQMNEDWIIKQELKSKNPTEGEKKKRIRRSAPMNGLPKCNNAVAAAKEVVSQKMQTISRKINVSALDNLFS